MNVTVKAVSRIVRVELTMPTASADALYNDIYRITNDVGIGSVRDRGEHFSALFAVYDALNEAGIDGTGGAA